MAGDCRLEHCTVSTYMLACASIVIGDDFRNFENGTPTGSPPLHSSKLQFHSLNTVYSNLHLKSQIPSDLDLHVNESGREDVVSFR